MNNIKKYKLALINPKGASFGSKRSFIEFWKESKKLALNKYLWPRIDLWAGFNLGLLIVASLTPDYFDIRIIDENLEHIDFDKHYDLVGITSITQQAIQAYQIADEFRMRMRGVKVVIGGIHATVLPNEAKYHADSVIVGEAEELWPQFIKDFEKNRIQPFYRNSNPVDLTKSPIPRYDLLKPENYRTSWIQTTRGCPHDCEFCVASKIYGIKYRHKSVEQVIKEIEFIKKIWNNPQIRFADDNMFVDKKYSLDLLKKIIPLNIRYFAQTDVSLLNDDEFLDLLRESGCITLFIGFESLSIENLDSINIHRWKSKQFNDYPKIIKKIHSRGIGVLGAFIIGFDNDDETIFKKTADFIIENHLNMAQITILTPLPGSRLRERLLKEKRILNRDWSKYTFLDVNFIPKKMSPKELEEGILKIYKDIFNKDVRLKVANHFKTIYAELYKKQ